MKQFLKYIFIFCLLLIMFIFLHFTAALIPSSMIEKNVKESSNILLEEGNRYKFFEIYNVTNNNYTDSIMINEAFSYDNTNPLFSFLSVRKNYDKTLTKNNLPDTNNELFSINENGIDEEYNPVNELHLFLEGKIITSIEYARYWHGYLIFLRPLLILFNISGIRILLLILFIILLSILLVLLYKKFGTTISLIFGLSFIVMDYLFVSYSLECAPAYIITLITTIYILLKLDKIKNYPLLFFIVGCIINFTEFLTIPIISFCIPITIYIINYQKEKDYNIKHCITMIIKCLIMWFIGYMITLLSKWVIYDLLYNKELLKSGIIQVLYRTSRINPYTSISLFDTLFSLILEFGISFNVTFLILLIRVLSLLV